MTGLRYWELAIKKVSRQKIIDESIKMYLFFGSKGIYVWGEGWSTFDWAIGNTVREILDKPDVQMSWWTDDVLTNEEQLYVKNKLNLLIDYNEK